MSKYIDTISNCRLCIYLQPHTYVVYRYKYLYIYNMITYKKKRNIKQINYNKKGGGGIFRVSNTRWINPLLMSYNSKIHYASFSRPP